MSSILENLNGISDLNQYANDSMNLRLGKEKDLSIRDLANAGSLKGKFIQKMRSLFGGGISAEKNTITLRKIYGEIDGSNVDHAAVSNLKNMRDRITNLKAHLDNSDKAEGKDGSLEKSIKEDYVKNPSAAVKNLKTLEKHVEKLANATSLLCHECSEGSKKTNEFVQEMQTNNAIFSSANLVVKNLRKKIEKSEDMVSKLRKVDVMKLQVHLSQMQGPLFTDFAKFYLKKETAGPLTQEEAKEYLKLMDFYSKNSDGAKKLQQEFNKFVNSLAAAYLDDSQSEKTAARVKTYKI